MPSATELQAGLTLVHAVAEAIREVGELPEGTLYAVLCGKVDKQGWDKLVSLLLGAGLVERRAGHLLVWVGPELEARP